MDETFTFQSGGANDSVKLTYDGGTGTDTLQASFGAENISGAARVTSEFVENEDGSFTVTYRNQLTNPYGFDSVTVTNVENIHIWTPNTYTWTDGNVYTLNTEDEIRTGFGDDMVFTHGGNDLIDVGLGDDEVNGGAGFDGLAKDLSDRSTDIVWNLETGSYSGPGSFTGIEWFTNLVTGSGNDTVVTRDVRDGGGMPRNDLVSTGAGNDVATFTSGDDIFHAGAGEDRVVISWSDVWFTGNTTMTLGADAGGGYSGSIGGAYVDSPSVTFSGVEHFTISTVHVGGNGTNLQDAIVTGDGDDVISTWASADTIRVGRGTDVVDGGTGLDGLAKEFGEDAGAIAFDLMANSFSGPGSFTNIDYFLDLRTGAGDDVVVTGLANDSAGRGDDLIYTRGGDDVVTLMEGADTVDLGAGSDRLVLDYRTAPTFTGNTVMTLTAEGGGSYSGTFASSYTDGPAASFAGVEHFTILTMISGGNGSNLVDTVVTGAGNDIISTFASNDIIAAGAGNDLIDGGVGADQIDGGAGDDEMIGGAGHDIFFVDSSADKVIEADGGGTDTVNASASFSLAGQFAEHLTLTGSGHIDGTGNGLANTILGNAGNNVLDGGAGSDVLNGGLGNDTYVIDVAADQIVEAADGGTDTVRTAMSWTLAANLENLTLTGGAALDGTGNAADNTLTGNAGANLLRGLGGHDRLDGGAGQDVLEGGVGNDSYVVDNVKDKVVELAGEGTDRVESSVSFSLAGQYIEILDLTGSANINATGNGFDNELIGNSGANVLNGAAGADRMEGGAGNDRYVVDNAGDKAFELSANGGTDRVDSSVTYSLAGQYIETLTLTGNATIHGTGNGLANTLIGNDAGNILNGGAGADRMEGRDGNDRYIVDDAGDSILELAGDGTDSVDASVSYSLAGQYVETLRLTGSAAINGTGNGQANSLYGNGAVNVLSAGAGDDKLYGGAGKDTLTGGAGLDRFIFDAALGTSNVDKITDFTAADDALYLDRSIFSAIGSGALAASAFVAGTAAGDANDRILYDSATGNVWYDADGSGAGAAVMFANLGAGTLLTAADVIGF